MENAVLSNSKRLPVNLPGGNDHPVVDLPFTVTIDGRHFRGHGLSLVAAYVAGLMAPAAMNAVRIARLTFQFDGFAVTLGVDVEIREGTPGSGEAELIFIHPTGPHLPQLRHILNAFIAGDLVGLGQAIGVAGTAAPKGPRMAGIPESRLSLRRMAGGAGVALLSLGLLAVAGPLAYQSLFVTLVPTLGVVVSTGEVLRATTTGQILFLDLEAAKDDVVMAIQAPSGDVQNLVMPCSCTVEATNVREGSTVLIGEPVLKLTDSSEERLVEAIIPAEILFGLAGTDRIELTFQTGEKSFATVEPTGLTMQAAITQAVLLRPDMTLTPSLIGGPVEVRILRNLNGFGTWANTARTRFVSLFKGA